MQKRRRPSIMKPLRRGIAIALVAATGTAAMGQSAMGQAPAVEMRLLPPTAAPAVESTPDLRLARRPWFLEKLTKSKPEPSIKMQPPRPPRDFPDPPSMAKPITSLPINPLADDGWILRGGSEEPEPTARPSEASQSASEPDPKSAATLDPLTLKVEPVPTTLDRTDREAADRETDSETPDSETPHREATGRAAIDRADQAEQENSAERASESNSENRSVPISAARELDLSDAGDDALDGEPGNQETAVGDEKRGEASQYVGSEPEVEPPPVRRDYVGYPMKPLPLNRSVRGMQASIRRCLQYYYARPEVANERSNWGMLHSIMVYGADTKVVVGRETYSAIAWIAGNNACRGQRLLTEGSLGIEARSGVGLQGHQAQMLAVLALCDVPMEYPLYAATRRYSVRDIVLAEMAGCKRGEELTFTLIGLAHYLDTDQAWIAADGQRWDFQRLIREELSQPIVGAACGGTHRLMGFAHALRKRRAEGKPIVGQWKRAEMFTRDFQSYCYRLQNRDGSMSTDWFEGLEDNGDLDRKIQTTGHMVEWLLTVTPDSQLQNPRLVSAIRFLLRSMYDERDREWKIGPKGHALRSLAMYYERVYRSGPAWRAQAVAQHEDWLRR